MSFAATCVLLVSVSMTNSREPEGATPNAMSFVDFFRRLVVENREAFELQHADRYNVLCSGHDLDPTDRENREAFFVLLFLHQLFTCRAPVNCEHSGILQIPYMWHWIEPNPRHAILRRATGKLLVEEAPPARFRRYQSFADVDRVPSLYLADLVTVAPQYEHPQCGPMYTFGWCSEREMAFSLMAGFFGHDGWVRQSGNHVWSVFPFRWRTGDGRQKEILLEFDNTFDIFGGQELPQGKTSQQWWSEHQLTPDQRWYNAQVRDPEEVERVRQIQVPPEAQQRIRAQVRAAMRSEMLER